jgi:hypothetical protein
MQGTEIQQAIKAHESDQARHREDETQHLVILSKVLNWKRHAAVQMIQHIAELL